MSHLARALLDELAGDPVALERLRELVGSPETDTSADSRAPAFTVATLAAELGRSERSIRAAIARGELEAIKRGRGWVIGADAVADWARAVSDETPSEAKRPARTGRGVSAGTPLRRRPGPGPATRALRGSR